MADNQDDLRCDQPVMIRDLGWGYTAATEGKA
jgi:hypothetical protein